MALTLLAVCAAALCGASAARAALSITGEFGSRAFQETVHVVLSPNSISELGRKVYLKENVYLSPDQSAARIVSVTPPCSYSVSPGNGAEGPHIGFLCGPHETGFIEPGEGLSEEIVVNTAADASLGGVWPCASVNGCGQIGTFQTASTYSDGPEAPADPIPSPVTAYVEPTITTDSTISHLVKAGQPPPTVTFGGGTPGTMTFQIQGANPNEVVLPASASLQEPGLVTIPLEVKGKLLKELNTPNPCPKPSVSCKYTRGAFFKILATLTARDGQAWSVTKEVLLSRRVKPKAPTGRRAAALKRCRQAFKRNRDTAALNRCRKRAGKLPI